MAESQKKQVYRRFVDEVINKGNLSIIPELYHPNYVDHSAPPGAPHEGKRLRSGGGNSEDVPRRIPGRAFHD